MKYAVFARPAVNAEEGELVGLTFLASDAVAIAEHRRLEGFRASVRSISSAEGVNLASVEARSPWVPWGDLPGVELTAHEEVEV